MRTKTPGRFGAARSLGVVVCLCLVSPLALCWLSGCNPTLDAPAAQALQETIAAPPSVENQPVAENQPATGAQPSAEKQPADAGENAVQLAIADWAQVQKRVAAHRGKVVVLDVWSTSCEPCLKEFPGLVAIHQKHAGDVVCMSLAIDYIGLKDEPPESLREPVLKFLRERKAAFENFLSSEVDEEILKKIDVASIPAVLVYDREGKLAKTFHEGDGQSFGYADQINPFVQRLVKP